MQTVSDAYAAQLDRGEQAPIGRITADWYRWNTQHTPLVTGAPTHTPATVLAAASSITVAVPGGVNTYDVLIAYLYLETTNTVTPPNGWTLKDTVSVTGAEAHTLRVFWHRAQARESGVYQFTWTGAAVCEIIVARHTCIATQGDPFDATNIAARSSDSTVTPGVSVTTLGPDRLLCWAATAFNGGAFTGPPGFAVDSSSTFVVAAAHLAQPDPGGTGSLVGSYTSSSFSTAWVGALIPRPVPPPTVVEFGEVTVQRSITSDLPGEVTLLSGVSTATATIALTGASTDNARHAGVLYSPYQPGNLGAQAEGTPVTVELGQTVNGIPERFTVMDGQIRTLQVAAGSDGTRGSAQVVDQQRRLKFVPALDLMVGDDPVIPASGLPQKPGLDVQRVVDEVARQAGYYASPPTRRLAILSATLHGSAWPEVGALRTASYWDSVSTSTAYPVRFAPGRFALATEDQPTNLTGPQNFAQWTFTANQSQGDGQTMFWEGWIYLSAATNDDLGAVYEPAGITRRIFWRADGTGKIGLHWSRNGAAFADSYTPAARIVGTGWNYIAWHITYGAINSTIRIRVNGTTDTITTATPSAYAAPGVGGMAVYNHGHEAVQCTTEVYSAAMFNDGFVPTAVLEPGLSELVATPPLPADITGQQILQDIAAATSGVALLDEPGLLRFWNRRHWVAAPAASTIQRTLRASVPLKTATVQQSTDRIRTIVRAAASPYRITAAQVIWSLGEYLRIPAHGTLVQLVDLGDNQGYQVDTATGVMPSGGALVNGHSAYRAARNQDGTGGEITNLSMTVEPAATQIRVTFANPNGYPAWLVTPSSGYPAAEIGTPTADLVGRLITTAGTASDTGAGVAASTVLTEWRDEQAIADLGGAPDGERALTLPASPWLQSSNDAYQLIRDIGYSVSRPCPQLSSVQILADPALQLGDLVLVADDSAATGINDPFWIVGSTLRQTATEAVQDLELRPVAPPGSVLFRDIGLPTRSTLDGRWHLA